MSVIECKELTVAAIRNGTVLDHITAGSALAIVKLLNLHQEGKTLSLGMHLPSEKLGTKDLIKIVDWELTPKEANKVALLAPHTTVTVIRDYETVKKFPVQLPDAIEGLVKCPNPQCISKHEDIPGKFSVQRRRHSVKIRCHYCHIGFTQDDIKLQQGAPL